MTDEQQPEPEKNDYTDKREQSKVLGLGEYYTVWREGSGVKQGSLEVAEREAIRLSRKHPGATFVVMQPISQVTQVITTNEEWKRLP